jgi:DNA-binding transcriptional ArsR family regulator
VAVVEVSDPQLAETLLEQAAKLDERAEQLRSGARDLASEAAALRAQAASLQREPLRILPGHHHVSRDDRLSLRTLGLLGEMGPLTSGQIAEHLAITQQRARRGLQLLEEEGDVKRGGVGAGTIWGLASDERLPEAHRNATAEQIIRNAAQKLGTFSFEEISAATPTVSDQSLRRWLPAFERDGQLTSVRVGTAKLYDYVRPTGPTPARPRHESPEKMAQRMAGPAPKRGGVVAGTGRTRASSPVVDELLREVRTLAPDVTVKRTAHKFVFMRDGKQLAGCSKTPGASSLKGTRRDLIAAGIPVRAV